MRFRYQEGDPQQVTSQAYFLTPNPIREGDGCNPSVVGAIPTGVSIHTLMV